MGFNNGVLSHKLVSLFNSVLIYLLPFFTFISKYIFRLQKCGNSSSLMKNDNKDIILLPQNKAEKDIIEVGDFNSRFYEQDKPELQLKFKFPTFEEFSRLPKGGGRFMFNSQLVPYASTSKYLFSCGENSISAVIDELATFPVREVNDNFDFLESGDVFDEGKGKLMLGFDGGQNGKMSEAMDVDEFRFSDVKNSDDFLSDGDFGDIDGKNEKINLESDQFSGYSENQELPAYFAGEVGEFSQLNDGDFGDVDGGNEKIKLDNEFSSFGKNQELPVKEGGEFSQKNKNVDKVNSDFLSENDFNENLDNKNDNSKKLNPEPKLYDSKTSDYGDANKLESLWEHQELIEQLKMELRKARATGLPTILEESESPKITENLKPWKIDENFQHEDCIGELHKWYKSYTESMRKFDILNYQKMYAMGFLQLKDPIFQSTPHQKPSSPLLKSLVSQNNWLFKHKSRGSDPIRKFINELQGDLEVVYVGQMCLSWEFLHWQYDKALDLWNSDPNEIHRYNEVAGEFQQFQVLVQRFVEDEPFQGPRVQNYVKSRCVLRNLLQVPLIREDCLKGKNKVKKRDTYEYVVTSEMLVEMVEESIRIFWQFVRSDKDCTYAAINGHKKLPEPYNSEDLKMLLEVKKILQKKEKKLKDLLRSENCILRKFRHSREDDWDQVLHFFAQVDMKLVSRVFNMSKITREQLIWCRNKLSRINFVNRKIYVEPGFLLFHCN